MIFTIYKNIKGTITVNEINNMEWIGSKEYTCGLELNDVLVSF